MMEVFFVRKICRNLSGKTAGTIGNALRRALPLPVDLWMARPGDSDNPALPPVIALAERVWPRVSGAATA